MDKTVSTRFTRSAHTRKTFSSGPPARRCSFVALQKPPPVVRIVVSSAASGSNHRHHRCIESYGIASTLQLVRVPATVRTPGSQAGSHFPRQQVCRHHHHPCGVPAPSTHRAAPATKSPPAPVAPISVYPQIILSVLEHEKNGTSVAVLYAGSPPLPLTPHLPRRARVRVKT